MLDSLLYEHNVNLTFPPLPTSMASLENTLITSPHSRLGTLISPLAAHIDWAACLSLTHKLSVSVYPLICGADKLHLCILLYIVA